MPDLIAAIVYYFLSILLFPVMRSLARRAAHLREKDGRETCMGRFRNCKGDV